MEHIKERLSCLPVLEDGLKGSENFTVREGGGFLAEYLWSEEQGRSIAAEEEKDNLARTYVIRDISSDEIVAYFSLRAGFVAANNKILFRSEFDTMPGIEISNFAVNETYINAHPEAKGIGINLFVDYILPIAKQAQIHVGARLLYIFALPNNSLIEHYKKWGFARLAKIQEALMHRRIRPNYDRGCIFMYQIL